MVNFRQDETQIESLRYSVSYRLIPRTVRYCRTYFHKFPPVSETSIVDGVSAAAVRGEVALSPPITGHMSRLSLAGTLPCAGSFGSTPAKLAKVAYLPVKQYVHRQSRHRAHESISVCGRTYSSSCMQYNVQSLW